MNATVQEHDRRKRLESTRLYGILDLGYVGNRDPVNVCRQMIMGGCGAIQLRAKGIREREVEGLATRLIAECDWGRTLLIINDFPSVAARVGADGVHVGQDDQSVSEVRKRIPPGTLVGKSTHSLEQAVAGEKEGADYIGVGPLFSTPTKPDYIPVGLPLIGQVNGAVRIPRFCIGGIKLENLGQVLKAGAERVVIVSGILQAEDISGYCREVVARL